ncbi:hypothetical protein LWI28_016809 [Acer negundo]|uniref:RNase H type-1 domain-containing protein n=1 Tax=Acer negundo TaxID=4023 RepID=A0AAD5JT77_ACENE|nr:hypothetical protein LWI28_016809 [Acer negundo]
MEDPRKANPNVNIRIQMTRSPLILSSNNHLKGKHRRLETCQQPCVSPHHLKTHPVAKNQYIIDPIRFKLSKVPTLRCPYHISKDRELDREEDPHRPRKDAHQVGFGSLVRNSYMVVLVSAMQRVTTCYDVSVAEVGAILHGLRLAIDNNFLPAGLESD